MDIQLNPILNLTPIESPPSSYKSFEDAAKKVKKLIDADPDIVNHPINRSGAPDELRSLQTGLIYLALTDPDRKLSFCTEIVLISRDNLAFVLSELTRVVVEYWPKMTHSSHVSYVFLLEELIKIRAYVDYIMLHLYRRMCGGDFSSENLWLIDSILTILEKNKDWLVTRELRDPNNWLLAITVFTLLRLIPDHFTPGSVRSGNQINQVPSLQSTLASLRLREMALAEYFIRNQFDECAIGGRDFIRLLHGVARLEPMKRLWKDLHENFSAFSSKFPSLDSVLDINAPQYFCQSGIPYEMEHWIRWMMKNVHCVVGVPIHRYQELFQKKFFSTPESQSLRVFLIRYIVTFFHPDNEMLASSLIPRWNVICWILSQSTCTVVNANAKLALFYDWLFYRHGDNVMNLEPALLAMMNHLTQRTQNMALTLCDFVVKITEFYYPPATQRMLMGLRNGLNYMIQLGVVKNLDPLLEMLHRVSPELQRGLRYIFGLDPLLMISPTPGNNLVGREAIIENLDDEMLTSGADRRPSTPPLVGLKSKTTASEGGGLTDPRLTRGHAAILAGAIPSSSSKSETIRSGRTNSSSLVNRQSTVPSLPGATGSKSKRIPPLSSLGASSSTEASVVLPSPPDSLLSSHEAERMDLDYSREIDFASNTGDWSPPPLPSSHTLNHFPTNQLPDTPESIELTIDNLRRRFQDYRLHYHYSVDPVDINSLLEQLNGPVRKTLEQFRDLAVRIGLVHVVDGMLCADHLGLEVKDMGQVLNGLPELSGRIRSPPILADLCEAMENLVQAILTEDSFDDLEMAGRTAAVVCEMLFPLFAERLMPSGSDWTEEQLEECLAFPMFVPFRHLWQMNPGDPKRELLLLLLTEMQSRQPRLGYHLLFYLKVAKLNDETMLTYRNFCASQENPDLRTCLHKDMQLLADDNRRLFAYLLPDVYTVFSDELSRDVEFTHLIVSSVDPTTCNTIISEIVRGHLNMFPSDDLSAVLKASLSWNSIEQLFFWQLINAHEIPTRNFLPLVNYMDPAKHPEACSNLILLFKLEKPSFELIRALISRPGPNDALAVTALHFWSCPDNQHSARFANILKSMILTCLSSRSESGSRDRKRSGAKLTSENPVDLSSILTHLDAIRRTCKNISLLQDDDIQHALEEVVKSGKVPLPVKDHFSDLLALAEDQPTSPTSNRSSEPHSDSTEIPHRLGSGDTILGNSKSSRLPGRGSSLGSKGGHSLRNLDSRRAAEAERRRQPLSENSKRSSRSNNNQANDDDDSENNDDLETISLSSSSTSSSSSSDGSSKHAAVNNPTKKRSSRSSSPVKTTDQTSKTPKRLFEKDRRANSKRGHTSKRSDEDDDDDEEGDGNLVVIADEDSDEEDKIRPPKCRKISGRRSALDD